MAMTDNYKSRVWFVLMTISHWEWVEDLNRYCIVRKMETHLTPDRATKEEANEDFKNLGFEIKPNREVQYAKFKNSKHIIEIMVLCHTEY